MLLSILYFTWTCIFFVCVWNCFYFCTPTYPFLMYLALAFCVSRNEINILNVSWQRQMFTVFLTWSDQKPPQICPHSSSASPTGGCSRRHRAAWGSHTHSHRHHTHFSTLEYFSIYPSRNCCENSHTVPCLTFSGDLTALLCAVLPAGRWEHTVLWIQVV